jgi:hypothetical protein
LKTAAGDPVDSVQDWEAVRRPELLELFRSQVYGRRPGPPDDLAFDVRVVDAQALNGAATRTEVTVYFSAGREAGPRMQILVYFPAGSTGPTPTFVGLNFRGNHGIGDDPAVPLSDSWMPLHDEDVGKVVDHRATEAARGCTASRWPVEMILSRGYAIATIYCGDIDPDFDDGFQNGVHPLFYAPGQSRPKPDEWATVAAWAWGLSRAMDYFETDPRIDHRQVAVIGHSRLGKTALWAGAEDPRYALVISNNSGCTGAAMARRRVGETIRQINDNFPHWFCGNYKQYNDREADLPVDQHMLLALMAPRPLYVASASEDHWCDPEGEFIACVHAGPVYRLYGKTGLDTDVMPQPDDAPTNKGFIGYHLRRGLHDVTKSDWRHYMDFADQHFRL